MARYYDTARPEFVNDFVYQPPWELINKVGAKKQQDYDTALASANILRDIQINHLNSDDEVANVQEKQRFYNDWADNIVAQIRKDPNNANSYASEIDKAKRALVRDYNTGDISKITGSYNSAQAWEKQAEDIRKKSPTRYNAAKQYFYNTWGGNSLDKQWNGTGVTEDVDWQKIYDAASKIKADEYEQESARASGRYIYKNKQSGEKLTEEEVMSNILGRVLTPDNRASLQQTQQFGISRYFDPETGALDLNAPGWMPSRLVAGSVAYNKQSRSQDMQSDPTYNAAMARAQDESQFQRRLAFDQYKDAMDRQDKINKQAKKGQLTPKDVFDLQKTIIDEDDATKKAQLQQILDNALGTQFTSSIDKANKFEDIYGAARNKNLQGTGDVIGKARDAARKGTKNLSGVNRDLAMYIDSNIASGAIKNDDDVKEFTRRFALEQGLTPNTVQSGPYANAIINQVVNPLQNFALNYVSKQNKYLKNNNNEASSQKVFEVPSLSSSNQATMELKNNPRDYIIAGKGITPYSLDKADLSTLQIKGVTGGQSHGSFGISAQLATADGGTRKVFILPRGNSVSSQVMTRILGQGLGGNSSVANALNNARLNEIQQAESLAKVTDSGTNTFTYRTPAIGGVREYRITRNQNGSYDLFDRYANKLNTGVSVMDTNALSKLIDLDTMQNR